MPLTPDDYQNIILTEVGAGLDGEDPAQKNLLDKLTPLIGSLWDMWANRGKIDPHLQFLYVKRQAVHVLMGQVRHLTSASVGSLSPRYGDKIANLQKLLDEVNKKIEDWEKILRDSRPAAVGAMTQTSPVMTPAPGSPDTRSRPYGPDPNDPALRGDALRRHVRQWPFSGGY
jgi:hypothetical protein